MPEFERPVPVEEADAGRWTDLIESAPRRRWPWRGISAVAALLAAVGLVAGSPWLLPSRDGSPPAEPTRSATLRYVAPTVDPRRPLSIDLLPVTLDLPGEITHFDIGPSGYAVVAAEDCDVPGDACRVTIATSHDLRHWVPRHVPDDATEHLGAPAPLVLGRGVLLLQDYGVQTPGGWYSRDEGRTWHPVPTGYRPELPEIAGGRLSLEPDWSADRACARHRVAAFRRHTGQRVPLRNQPRLRPCMVTPFGDLAGRFWVAGLDSGSDDAAIAVSSDSGREWRTFVLPGTAPADFVSVTFSGLDVYAMVAGPKAGASAPTLSAIFRFRGERWSAVWRSDGTEPPGMQQPVVCPSGLLLSPSRSTGRPGDDRLLVSRDGGRSWSRAASLASIVATAVPGYGWYGWYGTPRKPVHSRDCRGWYGLTVG